MKRPILDLQAEPHRRRNALTGDWVLVSPHRTQRPWQGQLETIATPVMPAYDAGCYLCPGNTRAAGTRNPDYTGTYVFDNDYAALRSPGVSVADGAPDLLQAQPEAGVCRVVCYSPRHDVSMAGLSIPELRGVVDTWAAQYAELGDLAHIRAVTIFENRGAMMGASNPHPHGQIWANETIPNELSREDRTQAAHTASHDSCLLCDYLALELADGSRLVCGNDEFVALVPFWAIWPFETLVMPRRHASCVPQLGDPARDAFAAILKDLTMRYDALFGVAFPYTMGLHQQPTDGAAYPHWHLHAHFYPPLLRSATVRKFMVGYEMMAMPQRDITAESAAQALRCVAAG